MKSIALLEYIETTTKKRDDELRDAVVGFVNLRC